MPDNEEMQTAQPMPTPPLPPQPQVAMAYVPFQQFEKTYTAEMAWQNGTLFMQLDKPFLGAKARRTDV